MTGNSFIDALHSASPAADRADKMKLYSWLIGHWTMDAIVYRDDGTKHEGPGEIHFGWVLEGRAIQDVWILPGIFYGTHTARLRSRPRRLAHSLVRPTTAVLHRQVGRAHGDDIVQQGTNDAGEAVRWSFTDVTAESFRWIGERSRDNGKTWQLQAEFLARRMQ